MKKIKSENGFTAMDATISIIIVSLSLALISSIIYNTYTQALSTHKNSMATMYAVEILEKINKLDYNDESLEQNTIISNGSILGINIDQGYQVNVNINEEKEEFIKKITVIVSYEDENMNKNITIETLKLNM